MFIFNFLLVFSIVPHGMSNIYSLPVDITLWGLPEKHMEASNKLKQSGYYLTGGAPIMEAATRSTEATNHVVMYEPTRRTILTSGEVKSLFFFMRYSLSACPFTYCST